MLLKLGRALGVALSCLFLIPTPALWAVSMPTPGQPLTLGDAIAFTLENHPRRMAASSEAGAAEQQVGEAKSAMLPQIYGAADYLGSTQNGIGVTNYLNPGFVPRHNGATGQPQAWSLENNYLGAVGASQYLFDFGRVRGEIAERSAQADAAGAQLKLIELDLIFQTSQRYFALLAARQLVTVYEEATTQRQQQVHESKVRAAAALAPQIDVYTAQAQLARAETQLLAERNEVLKAKAALDNAMGLGTEAPDYEPSQTLSPSDVVGAVPDYIGAAMKLRPDLLALEDQARAAGAKVREYRSDLFPTVNAAAGYNAVGTGLPAANNYNIGLLISWPIFNGMLTTHQIEEARLRRRRGRTFDLRYAATHRARGQDRFPRLAKCASGDSRGFDNPRRLARRVDPGPEALRRGSRQHHRVDRRRARLHPGQGQLRQHAVCVCGGSRGTGAGGGAIARGSLSGRPGTPRQYTMNGPGHSIMFICSC